MNRRLTMDEHDSLNPPAWVPLFLDGARPGRTKSRGHARGPGCKVPESGRGNRRGPVLLGWRHVAPRRNLDSRPQAAAAQAAWLALLSGPPGRHPHRCSGFETVGGYRCAVRWWSQLPAGPEAATASSGRRCSARARRARRASRTPSGQPRFQHAAEIVGEPLGPIGQQLRDGDPDRGLRAQPVARSGAHAPASLEQAPDRCGLIGDRHPHVEPRGPLGRDASAGQSSHQRRSPVRVRLPRPSQSRLDGAAGERGRATRCK